MLDAYRETFVIPSAHVVCNRVEKLHNNDHEKLKEEQKKCETVSISLDIWISDSHEAFLAIFAHWTAVDTYKYEEHILDFNYLTGRHTALAQAELVMSTLEKYEITEKLFCLVGDNASVNGALADSLLIQLGTNRTEANRPFQRRATFIGCLAHQLNMVVQSFLSSNKLTSIATIRAVADQVVTSPQQRKKRKRINCGKSNKFIERNVKT